MRMDEDKNSMDFKDDIDNKLKNRNRNQSFELKKSYVFRKRRKKKKKKKSTQKLQKSPEAEKKLGKLNEKRNSTIKDLSKINGKNNSVSMDIIDDNLSNKQSKISPVKSPLQEEFPTLNEKQKIKPKSLPFSVFTQIENESVKIKETKKLPEIDVTIKDLIESPKLKKNIPARTKNRKIKNPKKGKTSAGTTLIRTESHIKRISSPRVRIISPKIRKRIKSTRPIEKYLKNLKRATFAFKSRTRRNVFKKRPLSPAVTYLTSQHLDTFGSPKVKKWKNEIIEKKRVHVRRRSHSFIRKRTKLSELLNCDDIRFGKLRKGYFFHSPSFKSRTRRKIYNGKKLFEGKTDPGKYFDDVVRDLSTFDSGVTSSFNSKTKRFSNQEEKENQQFFSNRRRRRSLSCPRRRIKRKNRDQPWRKLPKGWKNRKIREWESDDLGKFSMELSRDFSDPDERNFHGQDLLTIKKEIGEKKDVSTSSFLSTSKRQEIIIKTGTNGTKLGPGSYPQRNILSIEGIINRGNGNNSPEISKFSEFNMESKPNKFRSVFPKKAVLALENKSNDGKYYLKILKKEKRKNSGRLKFKKSHCTPDDLGPGAHYLSKKHTDFRKIHINRKRNIAIGFGSSGKKRSCSNKKYRTVYNWQKSD